MDKANHCAQSPSLWEPWLFLTSPLQLLFQPLISVSLSPSSRVQMKAPSTKTELGECGPHECYSTVATRPFSLLLKCCRSASIKHEGCFLLEQVFLKETKTMIMNAWFYTCLHSSAWGAVAHVRAVWHSACPCDVCLLCFLHSHWIKAKFRFSGNVAQEIKKKLCSPS